MANPLRISIAAILKNECPYILEWIAYHRVIGIDWFFIADNASDDGSTELLCTLHNAGIITRIPHPPLPGVAPQLPAYKEIMRRHKDDADWTAFIDADEFLFVTDGENSIRPFMAEVDQDTSIGAIGVNWAVYGSSGHVHASPELVIERFSKRAEKEWIANAHYKSIVRNKAWAGTHRNPHLFFLSNGYRLAHPTGGTIEPHPTRGEGLSADIIWDRLRLNHYVVKSKSEFMHRKRKRGRATTTTEVRNEKFFNEHDQNDVTDAMPGWLISETKKEVEKLMSLLPGASDIISRAELAQEGINKEELEDLPVAETQQCSGQELKAIHASPIKGSIDKVEIDGSICRVSGWAIDGSGNAVNSFRLFLGETEVQMLAFNRVERADVSKALKNAVGYCGFELTFSLLDLSQEALSVGQMAILVGDNPAPLPYSGQKRWSSHAALSAVMRIRRARAQFTASTIGESTPLASGHPARFIHIHPGNIGNRMFRYMLAVRILDRVSNCVLTGPDIPEWGLHFHAAEPNWLNPLKIAPIHSVDIYQAAYWINSGLHDGLSLEAYAQRLEYIADQRDRFCRIFHSEETGYRVEDDELAINVRAGEILDGVHPDYLPLPIAYYKSIVSDMGLKPVFVGQLGDNFYTHALRAAFPDAKFISGANWLYDFQTIRNAKNIAISVSTFSWLAAWFSRNEAKVIMPIAGLFNPRQRPDVNLCPISDDRYYFYEFPIMRYSGSDPQRQALISGETSFSKMSRERLWETLHALSSR